MWTSAAESRKEADPQVLTEVAGAGMARLKRKDQEGQFFMLGMEV